MNKQFQVNEEKRNIVVTAVFDRADYQVYIDKAQHSLAQNVQLKGFRRGKVPFAEAVKYLKPEDIYEKMINSMIRDTNKNLLEGAPQDQRILNRIEADIEVKHDEKADTYSLVYTLALAPKAILGKHRGLKTTAVLAVTDDKAVKARLDELKEEQAVLEECEDDYAAALGDTVNIDAIGYIDNKSFEGGNLKSYDIEIGKHMFVGNFEEQLIGTKINEKRGVDIVFPEHYIQGYENKPAHFDVTVNSIRKKVYPVIDDDFAKSCDQYKVDTLVALKKEIKKSLEKSAISSYEDDRYNEIITSLLESSTFSINKKYQDLIEKQELASQIENLRQKLTSQGLSFDDYLSVNGLTNEEFQKNVNDQVLRDIKFVAIQSALIDEYHITGNEQDLIDVFGSKEVVDSLKTQFAEMYKTDVQNARNYENQITDMVFRSKVKAHILDDNPVDGQAPAKKTTKAATENKAKSTVAKPAAKKTATKKSATKPAE